VILLLLACTSETLKPDSEGSQDTGDTAIPSPECSPARDVHAALTDMPTVIRVTWSTEEETTGHVEFDTALGVVSTPDTAGTTHEALLVGNRADTEVAFRVVTDGAACPTEGRLTTGMLPPNLPDANLTGDPAEGATYTLVPMILPSASYLVLIDAEGEYVWAWSLPEAGLTTAFYSAELSRDGRGFIANTQAEAVDEPGYIYTIGFDGTVFDTYEINGIHTDFTQLDDGALALLGWDIREVDGRTFLGDTILERAADGTVRTVWNVWDEYSPDLTVEWPREFYPPDPLVEDWSHVNSVSYDADEDDILVTATFNQAALRIDRATGEEIWRLSGLGGDFSNPDGADLLLFPHSAQQVDGGVLVFNRGDIYAPGACSFASVIDIEDGVATPGWQWASERCLLVPYLGSAWRRDDGTTFVDWCTAGQLDAVTPEGSLAWRLNLDLGAAFGFAEYYASLYVGE
jgi:hypothetical protein